MRLLLFDIDGTLLHSNQAGRRTLDAALCAVFGSSGALDTYVFAGKTDRQIVHDLMTSIGFAPEEVDRRMPAFSEAMAAEGARLYNADLIRPCKGVPQLLAALAGRPDVVLGLLTGNIAETAPLKLAAGGIDPALFPVGAFGADSLDRNELLGVAKAQARQLTGQEFAGYETVVIGDTPADILCARSGGALEVAVATGFYSRDHLRDYRPHYLFDTLEDTDSVVHTLLNGEPAEPSPTQERVIMTEKEDHITVAGITFDSNPTVVSLDELYSWVIWQYPRRKGKGYYGAVRPSDPQWGWLPAVVLADQRRVLVFAHVGELFTTPESAAKYLDSVVI
jgi:phosphoglycolate phosphatase-like HAD superfamily hydrolase